MSFGSSTAVASQLTHDKDKAVTDAYKALLHIWTPAPCEPRSPLESLCWVTLDTLLLLEHNKQAPYLRPFAHACLNILPQLSSGLAAQFPKFSVQMFPYLESVSSPQST